ncbi:MAG: hypothetical protein LQ350_003239 [Teloschistes chrysophthalmus]|nr:MAG: hypothetical protein LQ350_003239 [Niorma chrysophthalma]
MNGRQSCLGDEGQARHQEMGVQSASNEPRGEEDQRGEGLAIDYACKESRTGSRSRSSTSHAHGKHLTCYFCDHGQCRKSAAECSYAHYDTGVVATSPGENRKRKREQADHEQDDRYYRPENYSNASSESVEVTPLDTRCKSSHQTVCVKTT